MCKLLNTSDFEMSSRNQSLNLKFLRNNLKKNDYLEHPHLKMQTDIYLRLMKHPILKMEADIRLKLSRLPFLKNQLGAIHTKPP